MPPRRSKAPVRSTQSARSRIKAESSPPPSTASGSPDPIALTPAPTQARTLRSRTSKGEASSPAPSSQVPSSEVRGGSGTKTRLRSGRRSKVAVDAEILGNGDCVVPSDEEEYEVWMEDKRRGKGKDEADTGESSKMAQERWAKQQDRQRHIQKKTFVPLFSPQKARVISPPLESQEWNSSGYTTTTVALSAAGSSDDPFTVTSIRTPSHEEISDILPDPEGDTIPPHDLSLQPPADQSGIQMADVHASQVSIPRSTFEKVPRGPAMEDVEDLDIDQIKVPIDESLGERATSQLEGFPMPTTEAAEGYSAERERVGRKKSSQPHSPAPDDDTGKELIEDEMFSLAPASTRHVNSTEEDAINELRPEAVVGQTTPAEQDEHHGEDHQASPISEQDSVPVKPEQFSIPPLLDNDILRPSPSPRQSSIEGSQIEKQDPQSVKPIIDGFSQIPTPLHTSQDFDLPDQAVLSDQDELVDSTQKAEPQSIKPILDPRPITPNRSRVRPQLPVSTPRPSQASTGPMFTPNSRRTPFTQDSPLQESQIGPHNTHLFRGSSPSPDQGMGADRVPGTSLPASSPPMDWQENLPLPAIEPVDIEMDDGALGEVITSGQEAPAPTSSPDALDLLAMRSPSLTPLPDTPEPDTIALPAVAPVESLTVDPALERFRGARSFRTRTTLQLQPYTRERLLYEAALRKGGLTKGKRAIGAPRDISQPDQGDDASRGDPPSTADRTDPEAIVIEPTPPPPPPKPVQILAMDYDEYYILHDKRVDPKDMDDGEKAEIERIARLRSDKEKAARRMERESRRMQKRLERFRREQERGDPDDETYRPMPIATALKRKPTQGPKEPRKPSRLATSTTATRTPGRAVTYTKRHREPSRVPVNVDREPTSESEASARVRLSNVSRRSVSIQPMSPDLGGYDDTGFDDGPPVYPPPSLPRTVSSGGNSDAGSGSDSDSSSDSDGHEDKRARIARRMLPAAMLRRLEEEAAKKERDKQAAKKRQGRDRDRSPSPARPGRAVVRHGHADGDDQGVAFSQFLDEVAAGPASSSQSLDHTPDRGFESDVSDRNRPIVIDSSSDDSGSQAEEDHGGYGGGGGGESLAQLYRGDFESLVAGKGRIPHKSKRNAFDRLRAPTGGEGMGKSRHKQSRPALGLRKQVKAPTSTSGPRGHRTMIQARLDFPADDRTPTAKRKRPWSRTPTSTRKDQHRPAIRLDDHVIFATDDFAFEEDEENDVVALDRTPRARKRSFGRTKSINSAAKDVETLDTGVGKARSWAYLDKLSVDFGIGPLPSGLYCSAESVPGSGRLVELINIINGKTNNVVVGPCVAYGVELYPSLTAAAVQAVVPVIFDKIYEATTARILSSAADDVDVLPLRFLGSHFITGQTTDLANDIGNGIMDITAKLELLDLPTGKTGQNAREVVIKLRWALLELAVHVSRLSSSESLYTDTAISLISLLLTSGFDKAIRPLKAILRGESDTAEISDLTLTTWIATLKLLSHLPRDDADEDPALHCLAKALDAHYPHDQVGPLAAERIWYLVFGLCAVHQFDMNGCTSANYIPKPQWILVRRAISLIKISHNEEAEEGAHLHQLQGRDRYIRIMIARCIRLSSVWQWSFNRESFSIATKDLGVIFKDRQYRNLPTEAPVEFPTFITQFDMTLTAALDTKRESAFELYLRLVCVAASDLISACQSLTEAKRAEQGVRTLVLSILPISPVKFNRILPPTPRQLGQLINRYSTMVAATYFSPSLLPHLLNVSKSWVDFENADFDSRQVSIRGLMYVAVACRHHGQSLNLVVSRLADILDLLQKELDRLGKGLSMPAHAPSRLEVERTMVMVVSCVKQVILHHTFDPDQTKVTYPDPSLLHESWTTCVFALDLSKDLKCSTEVVATIQAFIDARFQALPSNAKRAREEKVESQDEFGSLGFELDDTTLAQLGGETTVDPIQQQDESFATVLENVICPRIYRLLSDMLPAVSDTLVTISEEKSTFVAKLTKCFSDCAAILVIDHRRVDWSTFIGPFGKMSWSRLGDDQGRLQVGFHFMLNVARTDPSAFSRHEEDYIVLVLQSLVTAKIGIEYDFFEAVMSTPKAADNPILAAIGPSNYAEPEKFLECRSAILEIILMNISDQLKSRTEWASSRKSFFYRCLNLLVSSLASNDKGINEARVLHKQEYRAFIVEVLGTMRRVIGESIVQPSVIPSLRHVL